MKVPYAFPKFKVLADEANLPPSTLRILLFVVGFDQLYGRTPKLSEIPFLSEETLKDFATLSVRGFLVGSPTSYKVAYHQLKRRESPDSAGNQPSLMTLLKEFSAEHQKHVKAKAIPDQKALLRLRALVRSHTAKSVQGLIPAFFAARKVQTPVTCSDFCLWAAKHYARK